jgi:hypothetical protein
MRVFKKDEAITLVKGHARRGKEKEAVLRNLWN